MGRLTVGAGRGTQEQVERLTAVAGGRSHMMHQDEVGRMGRETRLGGWGCVSHDAARRGAPTRSSPAHAHSSNYRLITWQQSLLPCDQTGRSRSSDMVL